MKLLIVDANNLLWRGAHTSTELSHNGKPTGATFAFFRSLIKYRASYPLHTVVLLWDGGHKRRDQISEEAVKRGIVPSAYKENRKAEPTEEGKLVRWQVNEQLPILKSALTLTCCQQVLVPDYEADDVAATYVVQRTGPCVLATSDKDYYQLLASDVIVDDRMGNKIVTLDSFKRDTGLPYADLWIDVGALAGDAGDNIFGVPGVGDVTAIKFLKLYGDHTAVLNAIAQRKASNIELPKKELAVLEHAERVRLAFELKCMDFDVPNVPPIAPCGGNPDRLRETFEALGFDSLRDDVTYLT